MELQPHLSLFAHFLLPINMASSMRLKRPLTFNSQIRVCCNCQQTRHATLLRRPKRPYTFTQLITLTDGSSYLHRTTSPAPVYRATKDARNSPMWNPSSQKLLSVEEDEAGKLRAFRSKFGRGWDVEAPEYKEAAEAGAQDSGKKEADESLLDLITGAVDPKDVNADARSAKEPSKGKKR